jgi:hypothetical protein
VRDDRLLRGWVFGFWSAGGGVAVGALLAYLTSWQIGAVTGLVMGVVLAAGLLPSRATTEAGTDEEADLSDRLRDSPVYSDVPGNRFFAE